MKETTANTEFGTKLANAIEAKKNDINSFVWKYQNGTEVKLVDLSNDELQKCYTHCMDMLYNKSKHIPGKYQVRENIHKLYANCNAELLLRYLLHEVNIDTLKNNKDVIDFLNNIKQEYHLSSTSPVTEVFNGLPTVFTSVTIDDLFAACFDKLDVLNKKLISDKFILAQGIWLTEDEMKDLTEYDAEGHIRNRLDVMKERLFIDNVRLRIDSNGLSYKEFRSLVQLPALPKISSLTTDTLKLLRDKILLLLDNDLNYHINKWTNLAENIKKVADEKNYRLVKKEY